MKPGDRVAHFEILDDLGAGGMGRLLRARDVRLGREVAIKVLSERLSGSPEHLWRFEQEARAASALNHPNIVTVYEAGEHGGYPFLAMELVDGKSLREILAEGFPSRRRLLHAAAQIADGLAAAHEGGITHRDLKPENVMLTRHGVVKILDFGLAKIAPPPVSLEATTGDASPGTEPGHLVGTLGYMSPEQARGLPVDFRSDQFSFGTILYEMLAGHRPFRGATPADVLSAILRQDAEELTRVDPRVPAPLASLVHRCLAKDPEGRYASTREIARELESLRDQMTEEGLLSGGGSGRFRPSRRRAAILAGVFVVAAAAASIRLWSGGWPGAKGPAPVALRVAVLPFRDLSGTPPGALIGEGFAETVAAQLGARGGLAVLPASAVDEATPDLRTVFERTGAQVVVRGSLQFERDRVRATWAVLDPGGRQISSGSAEGVAGRLLDLQDDVARRAAESLGAPKAASPARGPGAAFAEDRYLQALGHLRRYENDASVDAAIEILQKLGDSAEIQAALARAYVAKRTITGERAWAERAIEASRKAGALAPSLGLVKETRGRIDLVLGQPAEAAAEFRGALAAQPLSVDALLGLATALERQGRDEEAERTFRRAIEIQPGWWSTHSHLGVHLLRKGNLAAAVESLRTAVRLSPDNTRALDNLGTAYQQLGRYDEAIAEYQKSIGIRPTASPLSNLGTCFFFLGRYGEAVQAYERATSMQPDDAVLWLNLGDALRWKKGAKDASDSAYRRSIELFEADLALTPRDADRKTSLALALARTGNHGLAKVHADAALEIEPGNTYNLYQVALVKVAAGEVPAALDLLSRAVSGGYPIAELERDPELTPLRSDPRFVRILASHRK